MKVTNFNYNGFCGKVLLGYTTYTAEFVKWSSDPGVAICDCSDGKQRLIPTYALERFRLKDYPEQEKTGVIFGAPCKS